MKHGLTPATALLLMVPPLMWAGNAVVGRMVHDLVPPITLNFLRWALAFVLLLPLAGWVLRAGSGLWASWRRFALLGLLGVGCYNALLYLALHTSTPINVTLVAASMPAWMLMIGRWLYGQTVSRRQIVGAAMSIAGVLLVLSRGDWATLMEVRLVPGDLYVLAATIAWAFYSWQLSRPGGEPLTIRSNWAAFLLAQIVLGLAWSGASAAGEWLITSPPPVVWGWPLASALLYIAVGPALLAYRCWDLGVQRVGANMAGFFANLTPLFAALLSTALLGEVPSVYHAVAFALIIGGIVVSSGRRSA